MDKTIDSLHACVFGPRIVMFYRSTVVNLLTILISIDSGSKLHLDSREVRYRLLRGVCGCWGRYLCWNRLGLLLAISCFSVCSIRIIIILGCNSIFTVRWRRHGSTWFLGLNLLTGFCKLLLRRWWCLFVVRLPIMVWLAVGAARLWKLRQIQFHYILDQILHLRLVRELLRIYNVLVLQVGQEISQVLNYYLRWVLSIFSSYHFTANLDILSYVIHNYLFMVDGSFGLVSSSSTLFSYFLLLHFVDLKLLVDLMYRLLGHWVPSNFVCFENLLLSISRGSCRSWFLIFLNNIGVLED